MRVFIGIPDSDLQSLLIPRFEELGYQVLYLTPDSLPMNIDSLETCGVVVVNEQTPFWVLREADEHSLPVVCFGSCPNFRLGSPLLSDSALCLVEDLSSLEDVAQLLIPFVGDAVPVTEEFISTLAILRAKYPSNIEWKVHNEQVTS